MNLTIGQRVRIVDYHVEVPHFDRHGKPTSTTFKSLLSGQEGTIAPVAKRGPKKDDAITADDKVLVTIKSSWSRGSDHTYAIPVHLVNVIE